MADTKISALTVATTPLAGTEVLPIVQSGVTKQVSVANLTAGRAVSADSLTLTNALTAANGGTGQSSYTVGDLLYASGTTALSKLADVATGNALISGGVGVAPSWGKIDLTTHVSGTLGVGNGGTGLSSVAQGDLLYGSAANTLSALAKNTTASRYLSNGGTSNNPAWAQVDLTNGVTGALPVANGGTGLTSLTAYRIPYGNGTSAFSNSGNFTYDGTNVAVSGTNVAVRVYDTPNGNYGIFGTVSGNAYVASTGGYAIRFDTDGEAMRVFWSKGVSIGNTTDPGASNLSVTGSARSTTQILFGQQALTGSATINATTYLVTMYGLSGTATLTLPSAVVGQIIRVRTQSAQAVNSASNNITSLASGAVTNSILPATAGKWADLWWDGSYWNIIAAN